MAFIISFLLLLGRKLKKKQTNSWAAFFSSSLLFFFCVGECSACTSTFIYLSIHIHIHTNIMICILQTLARAAVCCIVIFMLCRQLSASGFGKPTQNTRQLYTIEETNYFEEQNLIRRLFNRAVSSSAAVAPKAGDVNSIMNAIAVNSPKAAVQQGTTTIVETVTGIAPPSADMSSLMLAIAAKLEEPAVATETVTVFSTADDDENKSSSHHKSRGSRSSNRHHSDETSTSHFDLIFFSPSHDDSSTQGSYTPCPSYMVLDSVTITFMDASQCLVDNDGGDSRDDSSASDLLFASPKPTSDLSDMDNVDGEPCELVVTMGSQTLTYSNADACLASRMSADMDSVSPSPTESESESEPALELGDLDGPSSDSSSESESSSQAAVAKPVMGPLGYGLYQTNKEALTCNASTAL